MVTQVHAHDEYSNNRPMKLMVHETEVVGPEAGFAMSLLEKWGMVAAMPDGEDSAGRMKLRLSTPEEIVARAFETAALAFQTARDRGLIVQAPDIKDLIRQKDLDFEDR